MKKRDFRREFTPSYPEGKIPAYIRRQREYLSPFYGIQNLIAVSPTRGDETIYHSTEVFDEVDPDYFNFGLSTPSGEKTKAHRVVVFEQEKTGTLAEIFGSVWSLNTRYLTQGQVLSFCTRYPELIRDDGVGSFFPIVNGPKLLEDHSNLFFANAFRKDGKLKSNVRRYEDNKTWLAEDERRFVLLYI